MIRIFFIISGFLFFVSCGTQSDSQVRTLTEIKTEGGSISNAAIIKNPVSLDNPVDTVNVAKMEFAHIRFRYGEVEEGTVVTHTFKFTNSGKAPLLISNAKSTCGCTIPEWPKEPIPTGESGEIRVKFNTENKSGNQTKPIFISANTHPSETTLYLMGTVKEKQSN